MRRSFDAMPRCICRKRLLKDLLEYPTFVKGQSAPDETIKLELWGMPDRENRTEAVDPVNKQQLKIPEDIHSKGRNTTKRELKLSNSNN
jgi:hypothetical protein